MSAAPSKTPLAFRDKKPAAQAHCEVEHAEQATRPPWKILIVDDEAEVHNVTRLVLSGFCYRGRKLEFLSAYSGSECKTMLEQHPNINVILLDVVMEESDSGLKLVRHIREDLRNNAVRIILRTGQPGQAPEERVIIDYDINDYKEKTELTAKKLITVIVTALRTYSDIITIEANRRGLEKIIEATENIFERQSLEKFATGVLTQITAILSLESSAMLCQASGFAAVNEKGSYQILAATGEFEPHVRRDVREVLSDELYAQLMQAVQTGQNQYCDGKRYLGVFRSHSGSENVIFLEGWDKLSDLDRRLVELFFANVSIAFDNLYLNQEVEDTQREVIHTLGETIEWRSRETGNHVRRVSEYIHVLALKYGMSEAEASLLRQAAPMHDVGKLGVPDGVLNKPGALTPEELEQIRTHPDIGYEILKSSSREILKAAAIISKQHHERYDGVGYPVGLSGNDIHPYGRLSAVADVFDALLSDRIYRPGWPVEKVLDFFRKERGRHFDPDITDILLDNIEDFLAISSAYRDRGTDASE